MKEQREKLYMLIFKIVFLFILESRHSISYSYTRAQHNITMPDSINNYVFYSNYNSLLPMDTGCRVHQAIHIHSPTSIEHAYEIQHIPFVFRELDCALLLQRESERERERRDRPTQ